MAEQDKKGQDISDCFDFPVFKLVKNQNSAESNSKSGRSPI